MKSDNTEPLHRSISLTMTTSGLSQFPRSLYQDAKMDISGACSKPVEKPAVNYNVQAKTRQKFKKDIYMSMLTSKESSKNCLNKLLRQPPTPLLAVKSSEERLATWHP